MSCPRSARPSSRFSKILRSQPRSPFPSSRSRRARSMSRPSASSRPGSSPACSTSQPAPCSPRLFARSSDAWPFRGDRHGRPGLSRPAVRSAHVHPQGHGRDGLDIACWRFASERPRRRRRPGADVWREAVALDRARLHRLHSRHAGAGPYLRQLLCAGNGRRRSPPFEAGVFALAVFCSSHVGEIIRGAFSRSPSAKARRPRRSV